MPEIKKMNKRSNYLFKNTFIFTIGNLATKLINFFLIPLYTNVLTTDEYGLVDLITTVSTIAIPILTLNVMESVMRFNLDKGANHNEITKVGIVALFYTTTLGIVLIPLTNLFSVLKGFGIYIYLFCVTSASCQIFLCDLRGKEKLVQYSFGNILNTLFIAIFNILFLVVMKLEIKGYLIAYILSNTIVAIYAFIIGKGYKAITAKVNKAKLYEMLSYSVVLIPNSFMWWIMNSSDHLMVTSMIGVAANGIYAISYKLPTLISTLTGIFNQAWSYSAIKEDDSSDISAYTNAVFKTMIMVIMLIGISMMTFIKPFLKVYVSPDYYEAWKYTPFLIIGCVYLTMATFMATSYTVNKDSMGFLLSGTFGALLNIILNWILIPVIGVYGAAIATCISYISVFVFRLYHTRKYMNYNVKNKWFIAGSVLLTCSGILMYSGTDIAFAIQLVLLSVMILLSREIWLPIVKHKNGR